MRQNRQLSSLGSELRTARRAARLTQSAIAEKAGLTVPTVRQAERGRGLLACFIALAATLGLEISGRSLPQGDTLNARLLQMRQRRGWSQRTLAGLAGVSATTIATLERRSEGHLATIVRVGEALGVRLCLVPVGTSPSFWASAAVSSAYHGWTTPAALLERLYPVVGGSFDLDPCSPARKGPKASVRARLRYTMDDDGLSLPWRGAAFINPPFGRTLHLWVAKARAEAATGLAVVYALLPTRTDTRWWHRDVAGQADVWLLQGRLAYGGQTQAAPFGSAMVVWGAAQGQIAGMAAAFPDAWYVARPSPINTAG